MDVNSAILERLEKVVSTLQENSVKMGQLLAVHNEKLDKQDRIDAVLFEKVESVHREVTRKSDEIKKGCERDIRKVDEVLFEKLDRLSADLNRETLSIKKGCERDIRLVDDRLRVMEKKMWTIAGALTVISFVVSPLGQRVLKNLTPDVSTASISAVVMPVSEFS